MAQEQILLSVPDYVVFGLLLFISAAIGIYFGFAGGKQKSTAEFLLANRNMHVLPVAMSLLASFMSAITLLGTPAEIYRYGSQYWLICFGYVITLALAAQVYIPIFYNLKITSVFEYIELRFDRLTRLSASFIQILQMVLYMGMVLYAPSLALNAVTGLNLWAAVFAVGIVCTFYTTIGGIKAVMWTDTFQMCMMFIGLAAILIKGGIDHGGYTNMFKMLEEGDRLSFDDFSFDPRVRHTVWGLIFGASMTWLAIFGINQSQVQRAITCRTLKQAQAAMWFNVIGLSALLTVCALTGVVCYAQFRFCDPIGTGRISASDQLLPLYVMEALGEYKGIPGLFTAAIFSGALSTISSGLNSLSALTLEDFVRPYCGKNMSDKMATIVSKILAVIYGAICIALTFLAANLGGILQAALALFGMLGGPQLGLYSLGMLFPCANTIGGMTGFVGSLILTLWIGFGQQIYKPYFPQKPYSTAGCPNDTIYDNFTTTMSYYNPNDTIFDNFTTTMSNYTTMLTTTAASIPAEEKEGWVEVYKISYIWYSSIAVGLVILIGLPVSLLTGGMEKAKTVDPKLICPFFEAIMPCVPKSWFRFLRCGVNHDNKWEETEAEVLKQPGKDELGMPDGHINIAYTSDNNNVDRRRVHINPENRSTRM